jgi:hypothetical protein
LLDGVASVDYCYPDHEVLIHRCFRDRRCDDDISRLELGVYSLVLCVQATRAEAATGFETSVKWPLIDDSKKLK